MTTTTLPATQYAVQLVGPGQLKLNTAKEVLRPGPHQILAKVECVGLCFSDLKLLKQFDRAPAQERGRQGHRPRRCSSEIPSYVPGDKPTVPGHEVTCRIVAVGDKVKHHKVGERCLVQTDYRDLPTAGSNAAFGYNFEGGLQEYVLMDERVVIDPGRRAVPDPRGRGALAPRPSPWSSRGPASRIPTSTRNARRSRPAGGCWSSPTMPRQARVRQAAPAARQGGQARADRSRMQPQAVADLPNEAFDDIVYFGADKATIEILNDKLAARGIINIVLGGKKIGAAGLRRRRPGPLRHDPLDRHHRQRRRRVLQEHPARPARSATSDSVRRHRRRRADGPDARHPRRLLGHPGASPSSAPTWTTPAWRRCRRRPSRWPRRNGVAMRMVNTAKTPLAEQVQLLRPDGPGAGAWSPAASATASPAA